MAIENSVFWKRVGYIAIEDRAGRMIPYADSRNGLSLDFKFSGEMTADIAIRFEVGILGLTMDTINDLTVWNPEEAYSRKRRIQVFAGYEKDGMTNPLFDGYIIEALPTNPPEMWMNFKCISNFDKFVKVDKERIVEGDAITIFKEVVKELGMNGRNEAGPLNTEKKVKFSIKGTKADVIKAYENAFNLSIHNNGGVLILATRRPWTGVPSASVEVSSETGMLGLGNVSLRGAIIKRRLDDTVKIWSWVNLKSQIVPSANGQYFAIRKKHVGHFRGEEWYTELDCIRQTKEKK